METNKKVNRKYKDSVFTALFSDEKKVIELYNAIDGKNYPVDAKIEINTLDDILYLDRINDISFLLEDRLVVLIEQQSSINLNMPLRFLLYINKIYEKTIASDELNIYRRNMLPIPRPEFICLYNGKEEFPDEKIMKLSDSFKGDANDEGIYLELVVRVININKGRNENVVKESKSLTDYIFFTDRIRNSIEQGLTLEKSIDEAVRYCTDNGIMSDFLNKYRSEVLNMLTTEFDMEKALQAMMLDGYERGIEQGIEKGIEKGIEQGIEQGIEKGIEQGIEKGIEEKEKDIALTLLKREFPDNEIISIMKINNDKLMSFKALINN